MTHRARFAENVHTNPIDPPPFHPEGEVRSGIAGNCLLGLLVGTAVLLVFAKVSPQRGDPLPSPVILMAVSAVMAGFYVGVRFVAYWAVWLRTTEKYPSIRGVHPAGRGELPRNAFLVVLSAPLFACVPACALLIRFGPGFGPEAWLAIATVAATAVPDLRAARRLLAIAGSRWIKETRNGLDVLKRIDIP
jgi:hypothetical protein